MDKVYIGKIVSTHGIKGELRILSDFQFKNKVFIVNNRLIIDDREYIIKSYRVHKNYDMVTLDDYKDINEVLFLLKKQVYFNKEDLLLNDKEILDEDLIRYKVIAKDGKCGTIKEIFMASPSNKILRVELAKEILVPYNYIMIINNDKEKEEINIEIIDGMKVVEEKLKL